MLKNISLIVSLCIIVLSVCGAHESNIKLFNVFVHANIFHCLANVWAMLYVCFMIKIKPYEPVLALVTGVALLYLPWSHHIVGLSGCLYVLYAIISFRLRNKRRFHLYMLTFVAVSMILPCFAGLYHLVCYTSGVIVGELIYRLHEKRQ